MGGIFDFDSDAIFDKYILNIFAISVGSVFISPSGLFISSIVFDFLLFLFTLVDSLIIAQVVLPLQPELIILSEL